MGKRKRDDKSVCFRSKHKSSYDIRFTAEISEEEITFLYTTVFKGERFYDDVLNLQRHLNTHISLPVASRHVLDVKKGLIKGEALRLLRTNSSKNVFEEGINNFKSHLRVRGYPDNLVNRVLIEVKNLKRDQRVGTSAETARKKEQTNAFCHTAQPIRSA